MVISAVVSLCDLLTKSSFSLPGVLLSHISNAKTFFLLHYLDHLKC